MRRRTSADVPLPTPVADARELARLSTREREVLALASGGYLDKQIAAVLGITANTLRTYWTRIRSKLGEASRSALVALYVSEQKPDGLRPIEGASWHVDVARNVLVFYGDRALFPRGEIPLDEAIARYHPDDRDRVRGLLRATIERDLPPFTFAARVLTTRGVETASAYVEAVRDEAGRATRVVGRHVPLLDLSRSSAAVGTYRRDLRTGEIDVDDGYRAIFRLAPDEPDLMEAIYNRLCPEFRETMRGLVAGMIAHGERTCLLTVRLCDGDGERWISTTVRLLEEGGRPASVVATVLAYR